MGNCLCLRQKSRMNHDLSIASSDKATDDESAKSSVKDVLIPPLISKTLKIPPEEGAGSKDTLILDFQPKLLPDSDSEDYFSAADDETQLYDRTTINHIEHPESSSASCKGKLGEDAAATEEVKKTKQQKLLFELFNENSRVNEAQGRGVAVDLPADSPAQTIRRDHQLGKKEP